MLALLLPFLFFSPASQGERPAETITLKNGTTVVFLAAGEELAQEGKIPAHLCFPNGYALEHTPDAVRTCLDEVASRGLGPSFPRSLYPWQKDEVCGFDFDLDVRDAEETLASISEKLWKSFPKIGAPIFLEGFCGTGRVREFGVEDFLPLMLKRSPYAKLDRNPRFDAFPKDLVEFQANLFHPKHALLLVESRRTEQLEKQIRQALDREDLRPLSMSFAMVDETAHLPEKSKAIFAQQVRHPHIAVVFPAPARRSRDCVAFAALVREAQERFGKYKARVWSGIGTGLFWIEAEVPIERFPAAIEGFSKAVDDFVGEMATSFQPHAPLMPFVSINGDLSIAPSFAARHFWGAGCEDYEDPQASAQAIREMASRYLRRPALFVLWPESRKDEWKGFP